MTVAAQRADFGQSAFCESFGQQAISFRINRAETRKDTDL